MSGGGMSGIKWGGGGWGGQGGMNPYGTNTFVADNGISNSAAGMGNAAAAVGTVAPAEKQQAQYAQGQAGRYGQQQQGALGLATPGVANASQAQLNQSRADLRGIAAGYAAVPNEANAQYQQALGQSLASSLALAHSAPGGAIGGAGAMRSAQEQNAGMVAGAAGQEGLNYATNKMQALAGQAGAYGQLGQINLSQYGTAQQVADYRAQLAQQQTGQNEGFYSNLGNLQSNQQGIANQSTQSLGGLGVQAGLGEGGVAVGAQNATTSMVGTGAQVGGAVAGTAAGLIGSDTNMKSGVQAEGDAANPGVVTTGGSGESTVMSSAPSSGALAAHDAAGLATGALKGAGMGGTIGSILPGIGNAIGAAIGAIGGGAAGLASAASSGLPRQTTGVAAPGGSTTVNPQGYGAGAILSDERLKAHAVGEGSGSHMSVADAFLRHIDPYSYEYKDPQQAPGGLASNGRFLGVMAQDLEKTPQIGHQLVVDTPEGKKVNGLAALSATMAGLGRLSERVNELEKGRKGMASAK